MLLLPIACGAQSTNRAWTGVDRIVAVGDVHGDCERLAALLRAAGLTDARGAWTGGRSHLVQTGDVLGRGPEARTCLDLLMRLEREARAVGGEVHALIGNHEAMVLEGDLRYIPPAAFEAFGGEAAFRAAFGPEGDYGRWIRGHDAMVRINDILFVHGGISPAWAARTAEDINRAVRAELGARGDRPGSRSAVTDPDGPLWYRGYAGPLESDVLEAVGPAVKAFGVRRVVVGHTPTGRGIRARGGGAVIMIDVGMSRFYYQGDPACLLIDRGKFWVVTPEGRTPLGLAEAEGPVR